MTRAQGLAVKLRNPLEQEALDRSETNKNFTAAQRSCREQHTDLASVRNRSENEEIRLTARGNYVWIGLFVEPWKWLSPSNPAFYNWADGVPDNAAGNEDCASLLITGSSTGYWSDTGCDQRLPFFWFSGESIEGLT
nr:PREDICTED: E-selectin-like [Lepisosteus oculatus]